ncbi:MULTISPECIES: SCO2525 family SAM-dependent methyltransferase [unclassified Streptomyces]|uniref:SCO2525 family SAM-dependent methyltransferase n=1 Tax=unclassified Streptomyces TaxID=2593676 RepID=UPI00331F830A
MESRSPGELPRRNADAPWDHFDTRAYIEHNYRSVSDVDAEIISIVRDHFADHFSRNADHFSRNPERPARGIDVGAGANLYPALAMLPWCEQITLLDRSRNNYRYLREQRDGYDPAWDQFWDILSRDGAYAALTHERREKFRQVVRVEQNDLFNLTDRQGSWSLGTMFFVAESLSTSYEEFQHGVECFLRTLAPGAPFAAAFMEHSKGYEVGGQWFPACDVSESQVYDCMAGWSGKLETRHVGRPNEVRAGYTGMIVACGFRDPGIS